MCLVLFSLVAAAFLANKDVYCVYVQLTQNVMHIFTYHFIKAYVLAGFQGDFIFGRDPDGPSLSFRGHRRPAMSFRREIYCSAETARDTAVTATSNNSRLHTAVGLQRSMNAYVDSRP